MNVLVVVDMQHDFIDQAIGTPEAVKCVPAVVREIRNKAYDTVFATLDTHGENYMETREGRWLPVPHCIRGSEGWKLDSEVEKALRERNACVIEKPTFGSEVLAGKIEALRPDSVTFVGLCTDICVIANALLVKTALYECDVRVIEDATAGVTEEKKQAALEVMRSCQIEIVSGKENER